MCLITISKFVPLPEYPNFLLLNKYTNTQIKNSQEYKSRLLEYLSKFLKIKVTQDSFKSLVYSTTSIMLKDELSILHHFKASQNFIPSPCGNFGFEGWEVKNQNDEGWAIFSNIYYQNYKTCFASSYEWCELIFSSDIEEPSKNQAKALIAGSPVSRDPNCPAKAKIRMTVHNKDRGLTRSKEVMLTLSHDPLDESVQEFPWQLLSLSMEVTSGDRSVEVTFGGMDENWWKDNYGPRFGYCYLREVYL